MKEFEDYKKYRWFYTLSGKLVIGGKNSAQNDSLLSKVSSSGREYMVMHTAEPGSPFTIIISDVNRIAKRDIEECAIFTACFGKTWKLGKKEALIHIFSSSQIYKSREMPEGTWGVAGQVQKISAPLHLVMIKQDSVLRAVPVKSVKNSKDILLSIKPGKIKKEEILAKLAVELDNNFSQSEILAALPAGGISISKK